MWVSYILKVKKILIYIFSTEVYGAAISPRLKVFMPKIKFFSNYDKNGNNFSKEKKKKCSEVVRVLLLRISFTKVFVCQRGRRE